MSHSPSPQAAAQLGLSQATPSEETPSKGSQWPPVPCTAELSAYTSSGHSHCGVLSCGKVSVGAGGSEVQHVSWTVLGGTGPPHTPPGHSQVLCLPIPLGKRSRQFSLGWNGTDQVHLERLSIKGSLKGDENRVCDCWQLEVMHCILLARYCKPVVQVYKLWKATELEQRSFYCLFMRSLQEEKQVLESTVICIDRLVYLQLQCPTVKMEINFNALWKCRNICLIYSTSKEDR